jgi:hypothetical protein
MYVGAIKAYLLTEGAVGTGVGHFESLDCPLKVEAERMHSWRHGSNVYRI